MSKYKIINYPKTIEECHGLIDILVKELNDWSVIVQEDESNPIDRGADDTEYSITPAADKKFNTLFSEIPHGLNGGVDFGEDRGHRPTPANESKLRGSDGYHYNLE